MAESSRRSARQDKGIRHSSGGESGRPGVNTGQWCGICHTTPKSLTALRSPAPGGALGIKLPDIALTEAGREALAAWADGADDPGAPEEWQFPRIALDWSERRHLAELELAEAMPADLDRLGGTRTSCGHSYGLGASCPTAPTDGTD